MLHTDKTLYEQLCYRHSFSAAPRTRFLSSLCSGHARWSGLLAVAAQLAYAATLLELPPAEALCDGPVLELHEVLADTRWD